MNRRSKKNIFKYDILAGHFMQIILNILAIILVPVKENVQIWLDSVD
jgi:hypothetical protein